MYRTVHVLPFMTKMLNDYQKKKKVTFDKLDSMPVSNVYNGPYNGPYHCDNNKW